jgi:oligopeptide transport system ATP-binding protein
MALACRPKLLIADEPTTALDVTIQAQILELIKEMKEETGTSVILITHDLGLVAGMTDTVVVMYAGHVFESAPTGELFRNPQNPYTRALLRSVPDPTREGEELFQIAGLPPDLARLSPDRCPFADRCPEVIDRCREAFPPYHKVDEDHWTLCWVR